VFSSGLSSEAEKGYRNPPDNTEAKMSRKTKATQTDAATKKAELKQIEKEARDYAKRWEAAGWTVEEIRDIAFDRLPRKRRPRKE
jgi:hypothetical protein